MFPKARESWLLEAIAVDCKKCLDTFCGGVQEVSRYICAMYPNIKPLHCTHKTNAVRTITQKRERENCLNNRGGNPNTVLCCFSASISLYNDYVTFKTALVLISLY